MTQVTSIERTFRPRNYRRAFEQIPRHWLAGSAFGTHLVNSLNLLFPAGERFFVKSVRHFEGQISDPALRRQIKSFYAQEGRHSHAHERYFATMREHGLEFDGITRSLEWLLHRAAQRVIHPKLRLSVTVALEHYTAIMAEVAFTEPYLAQMHPTMREFLLWHAAEEIEHCAVAFDVMHEIDPSYALRLAGFVVATVGLLGYWSVGTTSLLRQDKVPIGQIVREAREFIDREIAGRQVFFRAAREYISPDFHPLDRDSHALITEFLTRFELEHAKAA
jgi:predicted metal-dependent hydrolase